MSESSSIWQVRPEQRGDAREIYRVHADAFPTEAEAKIVDQLRGSSAVEYSFVALDQERIVGHVLFVPVTLEHQPSRPHSGEGAGVKVVGLAPLGVEQAYQRKGVGSALTRYGIEACRAAGEQAVVVLGHPEYYPRFGFIKAWLSHKMYFMQPLPNPALMVLELEPGSLAPEVGEVVYPAAFAEA